MPSVIDVLKEVEPQEVVGQILANPKVQLTLAATMTGGGGVVVKTAQAAPDFSAAMIYLGVVSISLGVILTTLCIVHRAILIKKDLE